MNGECESSPLMFSDLLFKWVNNALDIGISEKEYWDMTVAELVRAFDSYKRRQREKAQERASFDYILANLIGRSVSRLYSEENRYPDIGEVYPSLFDNTQIEDKKKARQDKISAIRFRQFADFHNKKMKGVQTNE